MFMDGQLASNEQSLRGGSGETHQKHRHLSNSQQKQQQQHNQKIHQHQLYQKHSQTAASQSQAAKQATPTSQRISYQWLERPYSFTATKTAASYDDDDERVNNGVEPIMVICDHDGQHDDVLIYEHSKKQTIANHNNNNNNNKKQLSNSYTAAYDNNAGLDLTSSGEENYLSLSMTPPTQHYLTIEELRLARNSCWLCGCNWQQDHVSLDCSECGGYSLTRPCPSCDGDCKQIWKRNINETHDNHRATWVGQCNKLLAASSSGEGQQQASRSTSSDHSSVAQKASSCCSSQPSSAASSDSESECLQATTTLQSQPKPTNEQPQQQSHHPTTSVLCICN